MGKVSPPEPLTGTDTAPKDDQEDEELIHDVPATRGFQGQKMPVPPRRV